MNNVMYADVGYSHSVVIKTDHSLYTMGGNNYGELGTGNDDIDLRKWSKILENTKKVSAGFGSSFAVDATNTLWRWGTMFPEIFGDMSSTSSKPVKYVENVEDISPHFGYNWIIKTDNSLWLYGSGEDKEWTYIKEDNYTYDKVLYFNNLPVKVMDNVNSISEWSVRGHNEILILDNEGKLYKCSIYRDEFTRNVKYNIVQIADGVMRLNREIKLSETVNFNDVENESDDVKKAISSLSCSKIIRGIGENKFAPNKAITRAEVATLAMRISCKNNEIWDNYESFYDVSPKEYYYGIAGLSRKYGIMKGYEDNTFRGNKKISGMQFMSVIARVLCAETFLELENDYAQLPENIPAWAAKDVSTAIRGGLVTTEEIDEFASKETVTRAEAAVLLYRLYNKI